MQIPEFHLILPVILYFLVPLLSPVLCLPPLWYSLLYFPIYLHRLQYSRKVETDKYAVTIKDVTESTYVKLVPDKTGKYVFRRTVTFKNQYTHKNETRTVHIYTVYDSKFQKMNNQTDPATGYGYYELKKGKTYYIECDGGLKVILEGELLTDIASI